MANEQSNNRPPALGENRFKPQRPIPATSAPDYGQSVDGQSAQLGTNKPVYGPAATGDGVFSKKPSAPEVEESGDNGKSDSSEAQPGEQPGGNVFATPGANTQQPANVYSQPQGQPVHHGQPGGYSQPGNYGAPANYGQPGGYRQHGGYGQPPKKTSGMAITGFIASFFFIVPIIASAIALILGILAVSEVNKNPQTVSGKGLAISAIVLGGIGMAFWALIILGGVLS